MQFAAKTIDSNGKTLLGHNTDDFGQKKLSKNKIFQ